ncbi:hypothetical protein CONLIGDRAFT_641686 [Coniochaeta ligniaria NRRL 30616]|uniref:Zn(2)-C6 fungal-type domain-containing protein n=1 Tax=Coniochaeta ligniaria NRRL 30616 TaxID=1408157 RepID=A0A1J7JVX6_9PEZI|nr:hypothetical protein CONLIGDRAFT_641686 [Coniochaeta ligniaria NRRL 30616]
MSARSRRVPPDLRQRTEYSCDRCKTRKHKCTRLLDQPKCVHCRKYGYECLVTKPRKHRTHRNLEGHAAARVAILEGLVKGFIPEADVSNLEEMQSVGRSLGIPLPTEHTPGAGARREVQDEEEEQLVHDLQGQTQYIGPASSFRFHKTLRALVGSPDGCHFEPILLLGRNPARKEAPKTSSVDIAICASSAGGLEAGQERAFQAYVSSSSTSLLVRTFFENINVDFPVLDEATFLEQLDRFGRSPALVDPGWFCIFLCVLVLARRLCTVPVAEEQEEIWWSQLEPLLSKVMCTTSLGSIQALMLTALHLHNASARDTCWTLTGAAVRIGFAIGLHRETCDVTCTPLGRAMRKRVWWTLYHFEQLQVSSHDRPSAIDNPKYISEATIPRDAILNAGASTPPDYTIQSSRLVRILGAACRSLPDLAKDGHAGPLSPVAVLTRELSRWRASLPRHLGVDLIDSMPSSFQRSLILLHVQYHYTTFLITRHALLSRFEGLSRDKSNNKKNTNPLNITVSDSIVSMPDLCVESGREACRLLLKLDSIDKFNAVTWWDVYYLYSSALVLILSLICDVRESKTFTVVETSLLLRQCTNLSRRYLATGCLPGTMHRWLNLVVELDSLATDFANRGADLDGSAPSEGLASNDRESVPPSFPDGDDSHTLVSRPEPLRNSPALDHDFLGIWGPVSCDGASTQVEDGNGFTLLPWQETHWEGIGDMLLNPDIFRDW